MASGIDSQKLARYQIDKEIGYGPGTVIYLAQDLHTGKPVALKAIDTALYGNANKDKLMKEVILHQTVSSHPNIITIYDHFKVGNKIYIVMEYAPRGDLFKLLKYYKEILSDNQKRKLMLQICSAIEFIQSKNMLHRDIKPENILMDDEMNAKLCDFGWACNLDDVKSRYSNAGTFEYMSPECLRKEIQGKPADIWSLGILVYELYHGKEPFSGGSKEELLNVIYNGKAVFNADCPESAVDLFEKTVRYDPANRITIEEVLKHSFFDPIRNEVTATQRFTANNRQQAVRHSGYVSHSVGHKRQVFFGESEVVKPMVPPANKEISKLISQSTGHRIHGSQVESPPLSMAMQVAPSDSHVLLSQQQSYRQPDSPKTIPTSFNPPVRSLSAGLQRHTNNSSNLGYTGTPWLMNAHSNHQLERARVDPQTISPPKWLEYQPFKTFQDKPFKSFTTNTFFAPPSQTLLKPFTVESPPLSHSNMAASQIQSSSISPTKTDRNPLRLKKAASGRDREEPRKGSGIQMLDAPRFSKIGAMIQASNAKPADSPPITRTSFYQMQPLPIHVPAAQDVRLSPTTSDRRSKAPVKAVRMFEGYGHQRSFHDESTVDRVDQKVVYVDLDDDWLDKT